MTRPDRTARISDSAKPLPRTGPSIADPLTDQLSRLGSLLDQETTMLATGRLPDMTPYLQRKNMLLLQLESHPVPTDPQHSPALLRELASVRGKLARNLGALQLNIRALQELNELLAERHRSAESDGTYSMYRR